MSIDRRSLLKVAGLVPFASPGLALGQSTINGEKADYTLHIAKGQVELAPGKVVSTTLYNSQYPGPLFRFTEGNQAVVDIHNDTSVPELVHWHGQNVSTQVDGAAEEGSPFVPAHGMRRIAFTPRPSGFRFVHTHVTSGPHLDLGTYSGQSAPVYIDPKANRGAYDREVFLVLKEFKPSLSRGGDMDMDFLAGEPVKELQDIGKAAEEKAKDKQKGFEVGYEMFSINGKMLGYGEPVRVKEGERVLFHVLNASATEIRSLGLPAHTFRVVALDGNPVPTPINVPVLWLGTAERVSAIVEMKQPGVWILGDLSDDDRKHGMGIVIEYAGHAGAPQWARPKPFKWDYSHFGKQSKSPAPDETFTMTFVKNNAALGGFNQWTINGEAFSMKAMKPSFNVHLGKRYRLKLRNASDDIIPCISIGIVSS